MQAYRYLPLFVIGLAGSLSSLSGCSQPSPSDAAAPVAGICNPEAAQQLIGKPRVTDAQAKEQTGASLVRQIAPGQPVTQDYIDARVTIETDPASGLVVQVRCG